MRTSRIQDSSDLKGHQDLFTRQKDLYAIPFNFKLIHVDFINELTQKIIDLNTMTYDNIALLKENIQKINFNTVIQPLINLSIVTIKAEKLCTFVENVHSDEIIRKASNKAANVLSKLKIDCAQREDVFSVLRLYEDNNYLKEKITLHPEENQFFIRLMRDYKRNGLYIDNPNIRNRVMKIKKDIDDKCAQFQENIRNENSVFTFSKKELAGLPQEWFAKSGEKKEYKVTLSYPDYYPIMDYVKNRKVREVVYTAFNSRCINENLPLLKKIIQLRQELAVMLGYQTYTDYMAEIRMVHSGKAIRLFLDEMEKIYKSVFKEQLNKLTQLAREIEGDQDFVLQNFDINYYNRLLKEKEYEINIEKFNAYFSLDNIIHGTFEIYERLLGLKFIESTSDNKWHSDVQLFEVFNFDKQTQLKGKKIGEFYLDLHPRSGKFQHGANFELIPGCDISHLEFSTVSRELPIIAMVCNLPRNGEYLSFEKDVKTFFHEFGHVMHYICTYTKLPAFNAFKTELDFLEVPSQMLENWIYDPSILKMLSLNPVTGESIPQIMINQLNELRKSDNHFEGIRQLVLSNFDFYLHSLTADQIELLNVKQFFQKIQQEIRAPLSSIPEECFASAFIHITGLLNLSYDVGYFGYMMSANYAMDIFVNKFKDNLLNDNVGKQYRKLILEPGASVDGMTMLKNFLGRSPNNQAYIETYGLKIKDSKPENYLTKLTFLKDQCNSKKVGAQKEEEDKSTLSRDVFLCPQ